MTTLRYGFAAAFVAACPTLVVPQVPAAARAVEAADTASPSAFDIPRKNLPQLIPSVFDIGERAVDRWRLAQLTGAWSAGFLLRSPSSAIFRTAGEAESGLLPPRIDIVANSALPFSVNDGPMWAGRGTSASARIGARGAAGPLRAVIAPELIYEANADWVLRDSTIYGPRGSPPDRLGSGYAFPWYTGAFSIDLPLRFGAEPRRRLTPGQSSIYMATRAFDIGISTESNWWGPGIRNALLMSNNAPGFPHVFARSARPWRTYLGALEWRWLVGGLTESEYFDTTSANDLRSLAAIGVTLQPTFAAGLTVGAARSVLGTATRWGEVPLRWLEVFHGTPRLDRPIGLDSVVTPGGREQLFTLFARYVMPAAGAEVYGEWARTELPRSLRDFFIAPNHTQGYTLGLQWTRRALAENGVFRVQGEITTVEQSATFRDRPLGVWYASTRVIQGYTERGQPLGAAIGPGASSQWLAFDLVLPRWSAGVFGSRIRWNEDYRSLYNWPPFLQYCQHDVSLLWGLRGERRGRWGFIAADLTFANRYNAFFQNANCFTRRDIRNNTLSLTIGR